MAQALWGLASGGLFGGGPPDEPALHPDRRQRPRARRLGEDLGFVGVPLVLALFGVLVVRACASRGAPTALRRAARRRAATSLAAQALLIAGGLLGLLPLSGVVTPFLSPAARRWSPTSPSSGCCWPRRARRRGRGQALPRPPSRSGGRLGCCSPSRRARVQVQVWSRGDIMTRQTRTRQADGACGRRTTRACGVARLSGAARSSIAAACRSPWTRRSTSRARQGVRRDRRQPVRTTPGPRLERRGAAPRVSRRAARTPASAAIRSAAAPSTARRRGVQGELGRAELGVRGARVRHAAARLRGLRASSCRSGITGTSRPPRRARDPARPRDVTLTVDARLQARAARLLAKPLGDPGAQGRGRGARRRPAATCWPRSATRGRASIAAASAWTRTRQRPELPLLDRARYGLYPPGSTFKLVTAAAALRARRTWPSGISSAAAARRPRRHAAAGLAAADPRRRDRSHAARRRDARRGPARLVQRLLRAARHRGRPAPAERRRGRLRDRDVARRARPTSWASSCRGRPTARPRCSPRRSGWRGWRRRWRRTARCRRAAGCCQSGAAARRAPRRILQPAAADRSPAPCGGRDRRHRVVARRPRGRIAGKTGTAEVAGAPSHSWFVGFAPASGPKRIAFAVIVENGGYGARAAVPLAGEVVTAARSLQLIP